MLLRMVLVGGCMKYALLIFSPSHRDGCAPPSVDPADVVDYVRAVREAGVLVAVEQLTPTDTATSVRVRGEDRLVTDGPFMETKEHLVGFFLIDVPDLDTALDWAGRMPMARFGT